MTLGLLSVPVVKAWLRSAEAVVVGTGGALATRMRPPYQRRPAARAVADLLGAGPAGLGPAILICEY